MECLMFKSNGRFKVTLLKYTYMIDNFNKLCI